MNLKRIILPLCALVIVFMACDESSEVTKYDNWQARNEAFIDSLQSVVNSASDPSLFSVPDSRDKTSTIFFKKLVSKSTGQPPYLSSKVKVFYRGMLIDESVFGANPAQKNYTKLYKDLDIFDQNFNNDDPGSFDSPTEYSVNALNNGWTEILQWMKPGERWELYIPYKSGYGTAGSGAILGYSTLMFDLTLVEVSEY